MGQIRRRSSWFRWAVIALMVVVSAGALAACGSSDSSSGDGGSSSTSSGSGDTSKYQARLEELYKGTYAEPTGGSVTPPKGKSIWVVSTGQNIETSQNASKAMQEAGQKLGWKVTIFDAKFDPSKMLQGVQQAIAAKADGIVALYIDCSAIKTGLQQAKKANIPTVAIEGQDCNPGLFTHSVLYAGNQTYKQWVAGWGASQAAWVIAKTDGKAKTIINTETDLETTRATAVGWKQEFAKCPTCKILGDAAFVGADFGPKLQAKIQQQFIKHPDANSFIAAYDAALTSGGAQALKATGRLNQLKIVGGEGSTQGIKLIYDNAGMDACAGLYTGQEGYGAMDSLARLLAGKDAANTNSGIGWQVCDKDHNLPPKGQPYSPPGDYIGTYDKFWGVGS